MKVINTYLNLLKQYKKSKSDYYGIKEIGIFGSVARGEETPDSDVDVFVTMARPNLFMLVGIKQDLEQLFGRPVDVVRKNEHMSSVFLRNLEKDGIYA